MRLFLPLLLLAVTAAGCSEAVHDRDQSPPYDVQAVFTETDTNGDGEIDLCEFHSRIIEVFYNADTDKNGFLSPAEYQRLPFSRAFSDADPAGKGRISLHDFIAVRYRQFVEADRNHDGALSIDEVVHAYKGKR